jgi:signal transduction histidine kinase/CheY-like chemotaxis protein
MDSTNFYAYIPFFSFLLTLVVTTYIQARTRASRLKRAYMLFSIGLSMWVFWDFVLWLRIDEAWYVPILKIQSIFWIPIGILFVNFVNAYLNRKSGRLFYPLVAVTVVFIVISVSTDWVIAGYRDVYWGILHKAGPLHSPITLFIVSLPMFVGIGLLFARFRHSDNTLERVQLSLIVLGTLMASIISFVTTVLFPDILHRRDILPLHDVGIALHSLFTSIAVVRYRFLNIEVADVAEDMFARMQDGVIILDRRGLMQHANAAAREMLGLGHGELVREKITEHFNNYPDAPGFSNYELVPNTAQEGMVYSVSQAIATDKNGEAGKLIIVRDISEQKRAEEEIRQMNEQMAISRDQALQANRLKSQFLANMSHELRTPLNAVIGYSEMIEEEAADSGVAQIASDAEKINRAGRHLLSLINDILDLSKIEAGKMDVFVEGFDINTMLDEIMSTAQPLIEKNSNVLVADIKTQLGTMHSDQMKVRQVLLNLISNAAKFTHDGEIRVSCDVENRNGVANVVIGVADTGIGMTEEQLERLYDAFTQADSSTTRKYGGTGLGMAISKHFIDILGGEIQVESEYGEGTRFTLRVPLRHESHSEEDIAQQKEELAQQSVVAARRHTDRPRGLKVLVVDDDEETRDLIVRHLSREGLDVIQAADGEEGLKKAREQQPDVITLDVMMPNVDGWSVLNQLKADEKTAGIPVIMLSMLENQNLGYALGACEYLVKPVNRQHLISVVDRVLGDTDKGSVLVVEDDADMLYLMQSLLTEAGFDVIMAENGKQALEKLGEHNPSMILLDLIMPVMDGFEFLRRLRDMKEYQYTPVVVLSAADLSSETRGQLQRVVEEVVSKHTVSPQQLVADIKSIVGARA